MRLGSGIAPLRTLQHAGARVGLGVDGSASNDCSNLLDEARHTMLLQRVSEMSSEISARDVLRLATRGGAEVLGRDDIGHLAPGMAADIAGWKIDTLELAGGAVHDPLAALVFCRPRNADLTIVNGKVRVRSGELLDFDLAAHVRRHNEVAHELVSRS
jgi:cytosine/adenosine deaminase-related metal-dependent hydrolase